MLQALFTLLLFLEPNPVIAYSDPLNSVNTTSREELLEKTLYGRYLPYLGKEYQKFILCPQIHIERMNGDHLRHMVTVSALNYEGHHAPSYDRIQFILSDIPESGVEIMKHDLCSSLK
ncbi:hypothetical protein [Cohnella herbarum]|uniref:DUF3888 domain-containing protein n=1 Tax=Cohnella herbarum TaxID=2728023 RepID=A0A7Z2VJZ7_9BACL|nr:hypothetical protein [Cohnella herbarum]QJD84255.1 hypothetical protein HH215_14360 [Cohnella herbarum]